jgi:hypothetical protein
MLTNRSLPAAATTAADLRSCNNLTAWHRVLRAAWCSAFIACACACALSAAAAGDETSGARAAAQTWLKAADAGDGAKTWNLSAPLFQQSIAVERWSEALSAVRTPLGAVQQRALSSSTHATTLPGAPDGDYVVMQFHTVFEHKASAVETVTTSRQSDGSWRVTGYFVK